MSACYSVVSVLFPAQNMMPVSGVQNGYIDEVVVVVVVVVIVVVVL